MKIVSVVDRTLVIVTVMLASTVSPKAYSERYILGFSMLDGVTPATKLLLDSSITTPLELVLL